MDSMIDTSNKCTAEARIKQREAEKRRTEEGGGWAPGAVVGEGEHARGPQRQAHDRLSGRGLVVVVRPDARLHTARGEGSDVMRRRFRGSVRWAMAAMQVIAGQCISCL